MAERELRFWRYLLAAFGWKVPVRGLGHVPLNLLGVIIFGVLGLVNPGFWALGLGVEVTYLAWLGSNERFQKLVLALHLEREKEREKSRPESYTAAAIKQARLIALLDRESQARYQALRQACGAVVQTADSNAGLVGSTELKSGGLEQLLWIFLKLLLSRHRIQMILAQTSKADIEREIQAAEARLAAEPEGSAVQRTLRGTLDIQKKRLENLLQAGESLKVTEAELERIEKQVALMREEVSVSSDPELVSVRLDGIVDSLQGTTKWMNEHDELFGQLDSDTLPPELLTREKQ